MRCAACSLVVRFAAWHTALPCGRLHCARHIRAQIPCAVVAWLHSKAARLSRLSISPRQRVIRDPIAAGGSDLCDDVNVNTHWLHEWLLWTAGHIGAQGDVNTRRSGSQHIRTELGSGAAFTVQNGRIRSPRQEQLVAPTCSVHNQRINHTSEP